MVRRNASRKRKHYGNRTFGGGNTKNRRGKGNKGGKGRAGIRSHKRMWKIKYEGMKAPKGFANPTARRLATVTLDALQRRADAGQLAKNGDRFTVTLSRAKVVGTGALTAKVDVVAGAFSAGAKEKIEAAGGTATTA